MTGVARLASNVRAASRLGISWVVLSHSDGNAAMGACPRITKLQNSNLSISSGLGLHVGASATIAIEWVYGPKAHLAINMMDSVGMANRANRPKKKIQNRSPQPLGAKVTRLQAHHL